jgi:hypothetical protein
MIPTKLIVTVFAMFAIVSSGAITSTVLSTMTQTVYAQANHTSTHAQANNTTALSPDERHRQSTEQDQRQQHEQGQQQPPAQPQTTNTTAQSSQLPQPECPPGSISVTMSIPTFGLTNTDMCQQNVNLTPQCQQGTFNSSVGNCETTLAFPPNQDGQCPTGATLNQATGQCERITYNDDYTCPTGFSISGPPPICEGEVVVEPNCPEGYFFNQNTNECSQTQTRTQL